MKKFTREGQVKAVLELLRVKPRTTCEFRRLGILSPAPRIKELREAGYTILTYKTAVNEAGYIHHNIAKYVLLEEREQHA